MSVKVSDRVWRFSKNLGLDRLLLLAIADRAKDDGTAWPGIRDLVERTGLSERAVHYGINRLAASGELVVERGAGPKRTNLYRVCVQGCKPCTPKGAPYAPAPHAPVQTTTSEGAPDAPGRVHDSAPEPSFEPSENRQGDAPARGFTIQDLVDVFLARGLPEPALGNKVERQAAEELLAQGYSPAQIAECWQDIGDPGTESRYADSFLQQQRSFRLLASSNRMGNWLEWANRGKPKITRGRPNGRYVPDASARYEYVEPPEFVPPMKR